MEALQARNSSHEPLGQAAVAAATRPERPQPVREEREPDLPPPRYRLLRFEIPIRECARFDPDAAPPSQPPVLALYTNRQAYIMARLVLPPNSVFNRTERARVVYKVGFRSRPAAVRLIDCLSAPHIISPGVVERWEYEQAVAKEEARTKAIEEAKKFAEARGLGGRAQQELEAAPVGGDAPPRRKRGRPRNNQGPSLSTPQKVPAKVLAQLSEPEGEAEEGEDEDEDDEGVQIEGDDGEERDVMDKDNDEDEVLEIHAVEAQQPRSYRIPMLPVDDDMDIDDDEAVSEDEDLGIDFSTSARPGTLPKTFFDRSLVALTQRSGGASSDQRHSAHSSNATASSRKRGRPPLSGRSSISKKSRSISPAKPSSNGIGHAAQARGKSPATTLISKSLAPSSAPVAGNGAVAARPSKETRVPYPFEKAAKGPGASSRSGPKVPGRRIRRLEADFKDPDTGQLVYLARWEPDQSGTWEPGASLDAGLIRAYEERKRAKAVK